MINVYDVGDLVRCAANFKNTLNVDIDPSTVTFKVKPPTGAIITYAYGVDSQLVKDSVGDYYVDVNANAEGTWHWRFFSTGTGQAAAEQTFEVQKSYF
jgi:uncharacterized protein YfaS (alpha-2-macroglobulin family)